MCSLKFRAFRVARISSFLGKALWKMSWLIKVDSQLLEGIVCEVNSHVVRITGMPSNPICLCPDHAVVDLALD